ncbi:MAG: methyltransferase [Gordonia sp. (in: high G+C Gram-positive bacteria)]
MNDAAPTPRPDDVFGTADAADRLILDEAAERLAGLGRDELVVIDDVGGALTLGAAAGGVIGIRAHQDLITGEATLASTAERTGHAGAYRSMPFGPELVTGARLVLLRLPRSLDRLDEVAALVAAHAAPDAVIVAGGRIKHMSTTMNDVLRAVFDRVDVSHARQKSRVLIAGGPRPDAGAEHLARWPRRETHGELGVIIAAHGGVFAGTKLDIGSRFLIEKLPAAMPDAERAVDLGCGSGILAAWLARDRDQVTVIAADRSASAAASTRATASANYLADRIHVEQSDGLAGVADASQQLVVLNPPFHDDAAISTGVAHHLFAEAARVLEPGGELWCVWNSHLNYRPVLEKMIGSTRKVGRNRKFTVSSSRRRA